MGTYAATKHATWFSGYDMTGDSNSTTLAIELEALENTVFTSNPVPGRRRAAGLEDVQGGVEGFWDSGPGTIDPTAFSALDGATQAITQSVSGAAGDVAYLYQSRVFSYQTFLTAIGQMAPFALSMQGTKGNGTNSVGAVRGRVLKAKGTVSATGATGSVVQVGAVGSGQYLYAAVHVFSAPTTVTLQIQSDDNAGMTSPTTRMTVGPITAVGGTWATRVAGPITDDFWRVNVSAITGTSQIAVAIGIK